MGSYLFIFFFSFYLFLRYWKTTCAEGKIADAFLVCIFYTIILMQFVGYSIYLFGGFALLNILLAFELADKITAKDELEIARNIQLGLMPKDAPKHSHYELAFFNETAREVGGDFYDFLQQDGQAEARTEGYWK